MRWNRIDSTNNALIVPLVANSFIVVRLHAQPVGLGSTDANEKQKEKDPLYKRDRWKVENTCKILSNKLSRPVQMNFQSLDDAKRSIDTREVENCLVQTYL